jgi:uncharacterized membrane protein YsdA (DUF1294 family)
MLFGMVILLVVAVSSAAWYLKFYVFGVNLATMVMYFVDKGRAQRDEWRIPEATLHLMSLIGGAPGALLGRTFANHKTRKPVFMAVIVMGLVEWIFIFTAAAFIVQAQDKQAATAQAASSTSVVKQTSSHHGKPRHHRAPSKG